MDPRPETDAERSKPTLPPDRRRADPTGASSEGALSVELSSRRTGMSFQRTRLSAERTMMSVIRTALSLITFGFTLHQAFHRLHEAHVLASSDAPRRFGGALVLLGISLLAGGIAYQVSFMLGLRRERRQLRAAGLVHAESGYPVALSLVVALLLLFVGVFASASIFFHLGPFV